MQILFILPPSHLSGEKRKNVNTQAVTHARVGSVIVGLGQGAQEVKRFMIIQDVRDASVEAQRELHALVGRGELQCCVLKALLCHSLTGCCHGFYALT